MSQRLRLFCLLLLALLSLAGMPSSALRVSPVAPADDVWPEEVRGIVEPALLRQWAQSPDAAGRYIVYLDPLANPLPSSAADPRQQRAAIVNALRAHAQSSQAPLLALLRQEQRAGHVINFESLWIANAVAVQGRLDALPLLAALPGVRLIRQDRAHMLDAGTFRPTANAAGELIWQIFAATGSAPRGRAFSTPATMWATARTCWARSAARMASASRREHAGSPSKSLTGKGSATIAGYTLPSSGCSRRRAMQRWRRIS